MNIFRLLPTFYHLPEYPNILNKKNEVTHPIEDDAYLCSIFNEMPYGIINKKATGIGATTLELKSKRDSIIVMPTKILAYSKSLTSTDYKYIGSEISDTNLSSSKNDILEYDQNDAIEYKKYLVVADSLPKLNETLGEERFGQFFLMFDEIDMLQSDSHFRPNLERSMDHYFKASEQNRCVVSATIRDFSHPELRKERITTIVKRNPLKRNIDLVCVRKNLQNLLVEKILEILGRFPGEKILIAYNHIAGIKAIIKALGENLAGECGILCSTQSLEMAQPYFRILNKGELVDRITFMTSAYYAGIDIYDSYHLITVASATKSEGLSIERMSQIFGRCRIKNGILSDTIIFQIWRIKDEKKRIEIDSNYNNQQFKSDIFAISDVALQVINGINEVEKKILSDKPEYYALNRHFNELRLKLEKVYSESGICMIRNLSKSANEFQYDKAYFNIDKLIEMMEVEMSGIYIIPHMMKSELIKEGHNVSLMIIIPDDNKEVENLMHSSRQEQRDITNEIIQNTANHLRGMLTSGLINGNSLDSIISSGKINSVEKNFVIQYRQLSYFIPNEQLLDILVQQNCKDARVTKKYNNMCRFWALDENHLFKLHIDQNFKFKQRYTADEIKALLGPPFAQLLNYTVRNGVSAVKLLSQMRNIRRTSYVEDGIKYNAYVIKGLIPLELNPLKDCLPLHKIGVNEIISKHFLID